MKSKAQTRPWLTRRGFTLVEAMVATVIFSLCTLGVYQMLITSYKITAVARYSDNARAVLRTYADQFQRLSVKDSSDATLWLFYPTGGETGKGLKWGSLSNETENTPLTDISYLTVPIGPPQHTINAQVTREVKYVNISSGAVTGTPASDAAGYMLEAIFRIRYTVSGKTYTQKLVSMRVSP
jgi:prepilin-type N-terminal cleavage/methylation domain-containing protein